VSDASGRRRKGEPPPIPSVSADDATRGQLRGSTLLLAGRTISLFANFVVQIIIVRYLTQTDYGAWAYALSIVTLGATIVTFGLDRAITRFIPIYEERGDYGRLFGTLAMVSGTFVTLGLGVVLVVFGLQDWLAGTVIEEPQAITLIVIMIVLAPVSALDDLLIGMFAVFGNARAIFFRRHVLGPILRLTIVALLVMTEQGVEFLAGGYVFSGFLILSLYGTLLIRFLRRRGVLEQFDRSEMRIPAREVLAFTVPLLSSDLLHVLMSTTDAILLGYFHSAAEVGRFRVILPAAGVNQLIFSSFTLLFTPVAARLFARGDQAGINQLYWRTAVWMAIFSFPLFLLTFSLAEPITVALFEERYRDSSVYLALLSLGMYFNVALGFNGLTLKVMGQVRYIVILNIVAALANGALNLLLIPPFGALGAAIATAITLILHNVLKQAGLALAGVHVFEWRYLRVYVSIVLTAAAVLALRLALQPTLPVALTLAAAGSLLVMAVNRDMLDVGDTFPELRRIPVIRWLIGGGT
jgi:O-antigen/teichoic acid export membrane protein